MSSKGRIIEEVLYIHSGKKQIDEIIDMRVRSIDILVALCQAVYCLSFEAIIYFKLKYFGVARVAKSFGWAGNASHAYL